MIKVSQLAVKKDSQTICTVDSLDVEQGERLAVIGSNGSGKTTLLRVLAGLETDFNGSCQVGVDRRNKTYVHQHPLLFRGSVLHNVGYACRAAVEPIEWLRRLGVDHLSARTTANLSGGEVRRIALARALATGAHLLLLDEPLADLDPEASDRVCRVLSELEKTTIVVASPTPLPEGLAANTYRLDAN